MPTCRNRPSWQFYAGIRNIQDVGNGMGLFLRWDKAIPSNDDLTVHYNIYMANTRFSVFDGQPYAITTSESATINVENPGVQYYFAVKATQFDPSEYEYTMLDQIGTDLYRYPTTTTLQSDVDAYGEYFEVGSTSGFPEFGYIIINSEIMKYNAKETTLFAVDDLDRGAYSTTIAEHSAGDEVKLFKGIEDRNTVIFQGVAAWHEMIPRNVDQIGEFNVDDDGYKETAEDILTTSLSASDNATLDFPSFDYTSYHRPSLQSVFGGECVNSYVGGEFNGSRGLFVRDRLLARLDAMLQVDGESVILLKRKWAGKRCRCIGLRRENPRAKCQYCFGVGFDGGYDQYINTRPISESSENVDGKILVRIHPFIDDLELTAHQALRQPSELTAWTLNIPTLKDRDFIVRFDENGVEEYRYELLNVTRNRLFFGETGRQQFTMRRHDKTDPIYFFDVSI